MATHPPFDLRMHDGSRHFADLPQVASWYDVRDHVRSLAGAELTGFVTDHMTEAWVDFSFAGHSFSINDQHGKYWFFVRDPGCPEDVLLTVVDHFTRLLCCN